MQKTRRSMTLVLMVVLSAAAVAVAQPGTDPGRPDGPPVLDRPWQQGVPPLLFRLDLSDQQREQIEALVEKGRAERVSLHKELIRARHDLQGEMLRDEPDIGKVRKLVAHVGELRTQLQTSRLEQRLAVRKLLTPEQRDRLLVMGARRTGKGHRGRLGRPGRAPGAGMCDGNGSAGKAPPQPRWRR